MPKKGNGTTTTTEKETAPKGGAGNRNRTNQPLTFALNPTQIGQYGKLQESLTQAQRMYDLYAARLEAARTEAQTFLNNAAQSRDITLPEGHTWAVSGVRDAVAIPIAHYDAIARMAGGQPLTMAAGGGGGRG